MKKSLILSAALVAAFGANAEVFTYDFNETPAYCKAIFAEAGTIIDEATGLEGLGFASNYDFIDKTGTAKNTCGSMFNVKGEDGNWAAVKNRAIDLVDGWTYTLEGEETEGENTFTPIDMTHPFICWDQDGKGPARTLLMKGWGTLDAWADKDYNAIDADNWVSTKNAIAFNRNSNSGSRTGTYVQFPAIKNPTSLTIYIGHAGGKYIDKGLYAEVVPVVDGVAGEAIAVGDNLAEGETTTTVAKRYYKYVVSLPEGLKGNVAFRIGCGGSELGLYHVVMEGEQASSGIEDIIAVPTDENAPIYNVMGVQVDENYKGIVIKNGKKYVQK